MKKIKIFSLLFFTTLLFNSCEEDISAPGTPYASFESYLTNVIVKQGQETKKSIKVYTANVIGQDRTIDLVITTDLDPNAFVAPTSVIIPANSNVGTVDLTFKDVNLDLLVDKSFKYSIVQTPEILAGSSRTIMIARGCGTGTKKLNVTVKFDDYPEEVYWRIRNSLGETVLASKIPAGYGGYAAGTKGSKSHAACITPGSYTFRVLDQYKDGAGAIAVTLDGKSIYSSAGAYGAGASQVFTVD